MGDDLRKLAVGSDKGLCVVCGKGTPWDELVPVKLTHAKAGALLSGACGGCMLDVDGARCGKGSGCGMGAVTVEMQGKTWEVSRR